MTSMLLLVVHEWQGPGKNWPRDTPYTEATETQTTFASRLPLEDALARIRNHQDAYNARYTLAVNFRLVSVQQIPEVDDELLKSLRVEMVEELPQTAEDFK